MIDPSEFESLDEHIDNEYLDEMHPVLTEDELVDLEGHESDYIIVEETPAFPELNFDEEEDIPI